MNKNIFILLLFFLVLNAQAQEITGYVYELNQKGEKVPLIGANIFWKDTQIGTTSNDEGFFRVKSLGDFPKTLIVSYIGYKPDTIFVEKYVQELEIVLTINRELNEVLVVGSSLSKYIDALEAKPTEVITKKELLKAACCNLSESFTTNASVDVQFQDAVTGAKQIQLLGLAGIYTQIFFENMPTMKGIAGTYGLNYVPGPWMTSISISKGAGSVVNGYESIAGQINIDYKKPTDLERYHLNIFQSSGYKTDLNANATIDISEHLSTTFLAHSNFTTKSMDENFDSFRDMPDLKQINLMNRWKYESHTGFESIFGFQILNEERKGGQLVSTSSNGRRYDINVNTQRYDFFAKNGYIFDPSTNTSLGLISNAQYHNQNSLFGLRKYDALQKSFYSNLIFQTCTIDETHSIKTGVSFVFDEYKEKLNGTSYLRKEARPGIFAEYKYSPYDDIMIMPGARVDFHNLYGTFFTPRLHFKWDINQNTILRLSGGKGYRSINIFAENLNYFVSSRSFRIIDNPTYEEGWNYGVNLTRYFSIFDRELRLTAEFYRTDFIRQTVVDIDSDAREVRFYDLKGKSYSNTYQVEVAYELLKGLDVFAAVRYTDVKTQIGDKLLSKPLMSKLKTLITLSYFNENRDWFFDASFLVNGGGRIPSTSQNPSDFQRSETFGSYVNVNAQVTKKIDYLDLYFGVENLTNFKQENPIISANDPFSEYFDASLVWGPIEGRKFYIGLRLSIY
ncbi:MAG: TonB-dependent receptor [Ignavibacterium sp.]|nr:TonB-dependent receptor [Ignavibacterium sp.]MDW8375196.1 TonB-dependent receptor [Ignavibacteriales bacterium]